MAGVALGHARLSIIDLTTGDEPIASENDKIRIVVSGEFYGYESIQSELEQSGHRLRTRWDSEIALHLYEDLGAQCLHRLRGEFAFVLWARAIARSLPLATSARSPICLNHQLKCSYWRIQYDHGTSLRHQTRSPSAD
jgi:glucosamine 6-phosphate synthetase-like amidotransferase/phosphosugar isomerase protein